MKKVKENFKKNILVVQQYFYPDISAVSQLLGDLLEEVALDNNYSITVLTGTHVRNFEKKYINSLDWPNTLGKVNIVRIKTRNKKKERNFYRIFEYLAFYWGAYCYIKKNRKYYNAVISMTTPPLIGIIVLAALGKKRCPVVYYLEDLYPEILFDMGYIKKYWIINKMRFFNNFILNNSDRIITLGKYMTRKLYYNYNIRRNQIVEIPNWAKGISFVMPQKREEFVLLYSGNLGLAHDFSLLPSFLDAVSSSDLNLFFRFIGAGRQYEDVKNIFSKYKINYSFESYKDRNSHSEVLSMADMFIISQKEETVGDVLPSKFYSYVAAGRPLLLFGTERSEVGYFIKTRKAGCILESEDDIIDVLLYIKYLQGNRNAHKILCNNIRNIYRNEMGFNKSVIRFRKLLSEVLLYEK